MGRRKMTDRDDAVIAMINEGRTPMEEIMGRFFLSRIRIQQIARARGIRLNDQRRSADPDRDAKLAAMVKEGNDSPEAVAIFFDLKLSRMYQIAKAMKVKFNKKYTETYPDRNDRIVAMFNDNKTLEEIGKTFGITRERCRQIVERRGVIPRRITMGKRKHERELRIQEAAGDGSLTVKETAKKAGVNATAVIVAKGILGFATRLQGIGFGKEELMNNILEKVEAGESFRNATILCGGDRNDESIFGRWIKRHHPHVKTTHGRWGDVRSPRTKIIKKMLPVGESWKNIAELVAKVEGYQIRPNAMRTWAINNKLYQPELRRKRHGSLEGTTS